MAITIYPVRFPGQRRKKKQNFKTTALVITNQAKHRVLWETNDYLR